MISIFLPTNQCNQRCKYCCAPHGNDVMTEDTLINAISFIQSVGESTEDINQDHQIEWHAGEPLLLPVSFYEHAEQLFENIGFDPNRMLCTNLTLWDDEWTDFCNAYDYSISSSLDGPQYIHDTNRGEGTWAKVINSIIKLKENDIRVGCITVMSEIACQNPIDIYNFFKETNISVKLSQCIPVTNQRSYIDAMIKMFDLWWEDKAVVNIAPFTEMVNFVLKGTPQSGCHDKCNHGVVCVDVYGNVHTCERFVSTIDTGGFGVFGNVNIDSFDDIWYGDKRTRFLEYIARLPNKCYSCPHLDFCGGGCTFDSYCQGHKENRVGTSCESVTAILDHVTEKIGWMRRFR